MKSKANSFTMVSNYKKKGGSMGLSATSKMKKIVSPIFERPMSRPGNRYF